MVESSIIDHGHIRFIEYALEKDPTLIKHLSRFFEIPVSTLEQHMNHLKELN